ncbi:hypothetical protein H4CHR_02908 [Variovorax sp. PBS-H4]|uniref:hypothetical protein n=1 Tax=Variovorax sp. PBS-H4 TaxID=434008 RepID=UPI001318D19A|nr:hypothetical protein [Variovorax sp. PBS-H4]VTU31933.1 hypothetical protein H4CHR_02908 [Variovorax sp. PBS-H4]
MKFFVRTDTDPIRYFGTQGDAHEDGRKEEPVWRSAVRIKEVDLKVDKDAVLRLLREGPEGAQDLLEGRGRVWTITARGGLKDIE